MSNNSDMLKLMKLVESAAPKFAGEPAQKPGDQVRGTDVAKTGGKEHPFKNRLVGEATVDEDVLNKKYQDFKDLQAKEAAEKKDKKADKPDLSESDYEDEDDYNEDEANGFFVCIGSEDEGGFVGLVTKDGGKWRESTIAGNPPYNWGGGYMSYLTPDDVMQHIRNDYRRSDVEGPFYDEDEAMEYARMQYGLGDDIGIDEGIGETSPAAQAITRRILLQRTDLLSKYGPEKVGQAIDEVADFIGDVEEIGSSDVSGWVRHVEQMLGNMEESMTEGVAETVPMYDAKKILSHYGADHFKTTSNEMHFYKNGRPFSVDLIWGNEGERSVNLSQLNSVTRQLKGQGVAEGSEEANTSHQHHVVSKLDGNVLASYKTKQEAHKNAHGNPVVSGSLETIGDKQYAREQGVAEDAVDDFLARGGKVQHGKFRKPRKSERTDYGSRHIGGMRDAASGKGGKTLGKAAATNFMGTGKAVVGEAGSNPTDTVTLDIPLFIRMMEYAREDAKSDMDLHSATERMVKLASSGETLSMDSYDSIVGMQNEQQVNEFGADGSAVGSVAQAKQMAVATKPTTGPAQPGQANAAPTSAPTTTSTSSTVKPGTQDIQPDEQDALDKIKANAGLKTQYDQLLQKAKTSV